MTVTVEGYGEARVFIKASGNHDNKAQIRATTMDGIVFYTSQVLGQCPIEDFMAAQMVAEALLSNWDSTMSVGLGTFVNADLEKDWPTI